MLFLSSPSNGAPHTMLIVTFSTIINICSLISMGEPALLYMHILHHFSYSLLAKCIAGIKARIAHQLMNKNLSHLPPLRPIRAENNINPTIK
ncbi:hypothetical protein SLEP1_g42201 [Rubroshorea leprosula]|uniref:Uncharacterized protein n=1 Tax=Rubroshorea leprosula TaxID=152421 RepID=A0AAV5L9B2_9ROSI|nr:hypothetical protein SLEP1_g42201 [Rubroshorea leprosula]